MFPEHPLGGNRIWVRFDLNCIPSGELFILFRSGLIYIYIYKV